MIERRKLIEVEEKEILRRDKELEATVKLPAAAESYKLQVYNFTCLPFRVRKIRFLENTGLKVSIFRQHFFSFTRRVTIFYKEVWYPHDLKNFLNFVRFLA